MLSAMGMPEHDQDVIEEFQQSLAVSDRQHSQKQTLPARTLEPRGQKDLEAMTISKTGANIDEEYLDREAPQPSAKSGFESSPSRGQQSRYTYRIFIDLFVWIVMTGSVP